MPEYNFQCTKCQNGFESFQTIKNMDKPLDMPCPSCLRDGHMIRIVGSPGLGDPVRLESTKGRTKPPNQFNDILREMKKNFPGNKIEVRE
jgi:putative FmdB family regulatory protein